MKTSEAISQLIDVGASREAIQRHYDVSNDFYKLWLDPTMTYSCALFKKEDDDLLTAQEQKLDFHIHQAHARGAERVLDVGCGWGACVNRLTQKHGVAKAVGLTLSEAQRQYVVEMNNPKVECRPSSCINKDISG